MTVDLEAAAVLILLRFFILQASICFNTTQNTKMMKHLIDTGFTVILQRKAAVAQLDRASDYGSEGSAFESRRVQFFYEPKQTALSDSIGI